MAVKLFIFAKHVIQYQSPIFREIQKVNEISSTVYYLDKIGVDYLLQPEFKRSIVWDNAIVSGFNYKFLRNSSRSRVKGFWSRVNLGIPHLLWKKRPDIVLLHGLDTFSCFLVILFCKILRIPLLFRGEGIDIPRSGRFFSFFKKILSAIVLKAASTVFYSCSGNLSYYLARGVPRHKLSFLPCCVDNEYFLSAANDLSKMKMHIRDQFSIPNNKIIVLFCGRFVERKQPLQLIEAIHLLPDQLKNRILCLFVGAGPLEDKITSFARTLSVDVHVAGFKNQSELPPYYAMSDIFYINSSFDSSPKALNEALCFSLPIITSDRVGTCDDLVRNPASGIVVDHNNIDELVVSLESLVVNVDARKSMGTRGMQEVVKWSPERCADILEGVVLNHVSGKNF